MMERLLNCRACHSKLAEGTDENLLRWEHDNKFEKGERNRLLVFLPEYCLVCAKEKALGVLPSLGTTMHGAGGGHRVIRDPRGL